MDILVLSSGSRVKLVEYFVKAFHKNNAKVYTADCSELAPSLYVSDGYFIVPRIDSDNYIEYIIKVCKQNNISAVLSLIDPELTLLSKNEKKLRDNDIIPLISSQQAIEICFDKSLFYDFCVEQNLPTVKTFKYTEKIVSKLEKYPYFAKPSCGSASLNMVKIEKKSDFNHIKNNSDYIIQEYIEGVEYGVDVYIDLLSGEIIDMFIKEKVKMRAGETDKSISVNIPEIESLVIKLVSSLDFKGPIDIDIFKTKDGEYLLSEVNPRFGGGYLHAQESGCDFPKLIVNNMNNEINEVVKRNFKKSVMMKYSSVIFKNI